jgi:ornithine cyclodeaminase
MPSASNASRLLDAARTAAALPYAALAAEIAQLLQDGSVRVPRRIVQPLPGGGSLFVMPAHDAHTAIAKLITFTPANAGTGRATIQGDVIVFDIASGERTLVLHGPTVTARRTAAVSLLAAQLLAPAPGGPLLIVGAGVQGRAHLEAFAEGLRIRGVLIASRSRDSAEALARYARTLGLQADVAGDPNAALAQCPLAITCTPAREVVLDAAPRDDGFVAAVGAFAPDMVEIGAAMGHHVAKHGTVIVDADDAKYEAGDLLQAGLDVAQFATLADVVRGARRREQGSVLFKSCGFAAWDLAAARLARRRAAV